MRKYHAKKNTGLEFRDEVTAAYSGQINCTLSAWEDGKIIGLLEYVEFNGEPTISWVWVLPSRQGQRIGGDLIKQLQRNYPDETIKWGGLLTAKGSRLKRSLER